MELAKIEQLLNAYFEGETNLEDEKILRNYFLNENVPTHLLQYKPIFVGLEAARKERLQKEIDLPKPETAAFTNWEIYSCSNIGFILFGWRSLFFSLQ